MQPHIIPGNPPIEVILRHSTRARRISLRVSRLDGRVTLTLPKGVREAEALDFARQKQDWLRHQIARQPDQVQVGIGVELPFEGRPLLVTQGAGRKVDIAQGELRVPGSPDRTAARLQGWLKEMARDRLTAASDRYAARLGKSYSRITMRDTRSRWGSCSSAGALMYSWRLILAPATVLEYVAAHEVAHLKEMNHSSAFWDTVDDIHGPCTEQRKWLRDNSEFLHRYRFGD
ncbi:SprT family zinc-dependent metalloprotease [Shimia thalassica]|uniref:M48 family metallopeptidase n=1 Tax=Shimia thalassica TaxID=1715693 RepID=UPI0026E3CA6E|nr:SprT family zinc-dependent metalloprotease [Shimia thalassica]MDO6522006.1 SprT family zinc-dependent metalloprotease [Shimia thalassica]